MCAKHAPICAVTRGFRRGSYQWKVKDLDSLERHQVVESGIFEIAGYKWRLALFRGFRHGIPPELIRIFLFSCNARGLCADVGFETVNRHMEDTPLKRKQKVACPFQIIERRFLPLEEFVGNLQNPQRELVVRVDLKNIREATLDELRKSNLNMRTVNLEVIDRESISQQLNGRTGGGIVSPDRKRYSDVNGSSLVRLWAEQSPDHRYWHCERSADGGVIVKGCLNTAGWLQRFEEICDDSRGGYPWVTVFREEKKPNETFQPICDDTFLVFFMLCEEPHEDFEYLGYLLPQPSTSCRDLLMKSEGLAQLQEGEEYRAFHVAEAGLKDITDVTSSLAECGLHSSSVITLRRRSTHAHTAKRFSQQVVFIPQKELTLHSERDRESSDDSAPANQFSSNLCSLKKMECLIGSKSEETPAAGSGAFQVSSRSVSDVQTKQQTVGEVLHITIARQQEKALKEIQAELLANVCRAVKEPIMEEIKQVANNVEAARQTADATYEELCRANIAANVVLEQLTSDEDIHLQLNDRDGRPALMMADDYVQDPIFLLDRQLDCRMRVSLAHKYQRDAANFRIKYISAKPSDGVEIGLMAFETKSPKEGNEAIAFFNLDLFQSPRLSLGCPQFGTVEERYVRMDVTIGIEANAGGHIGTQKATFEMNGQILCRPATAFDLTNLQRFRRFTSDTWRNCPQWIRDSAHGAVFVMSTAIGTSQQTGRLTFFGNMGCTIRSLLILPCFRLRSG